MLVDIINFKHPKLTINNWQLAKQQSWCVLGLNGSGKQYVDKLLMGELSAISTDKLILPKPSTVSVISFETQQAVYEHELKIDSTDFLDKKDVGTKAKEFLPSNKLDDPLVNAFGLSHRLESGYRQLSTGEGRKLLILSSIFAGAQILVCDNPFDSLDEGSCLALSTAFEKVSILGITVVLLLSNRQDIPHWCKNLAFIDQGLFQVVGELDNEKKQQKLTALLAPSTPSIQEENEWPSSHHAFEAYQHPFLVKLTQGQVSYGGVNVLENLNLTIKPLQHTLITGANGSGKSTLLQLITGDCTQCYSNNLEVLGFKRGSGETIWELKKEMGIVSAEMHRQYRVNGDVLTVVVSGFYDSIGLYQKPEVDKVQVARQWLKKVGLIEHQHTPFKVLSYGEQRLVLIARALVKSPFLLILDEPTQGLDEINRCRILNFIEHLNTQKHSTILLVSHRKDEYLSLFKQHIEL